MSKQGLTAEDIYSVYHQETNKIQGRNVRRVKNFTNAKSKPWWPSFENCANFINRNRGHVDHILYIRALAEYYEGRFDPKHLSGPKSIKLYKDYVRRIQDDSDPARMKDEMLRSIKFIALYCAKKNIDIYEYLNEDIHLIPTILKHYSAGSISMYFLASFKEFNQVLSEYPNDAVYDYLPNYQETFGTYRMRIINNKKTKTIYDNLVYLIEQCINSVAK